MSSQDAIADQLAVAAQDLKRALDVETDLEAENARLQEEVEHALSMPLNERIDALVVSRDGYKTLAERRGEALKAEYLNRSHCCDKCTCPSPCCVEKSTLLAATSGTGAALAATPEDLTNC